MKMGKNMRRMRRVQMQSSYHQKLPHPKLLLVVDPPMLVPLAAPIKVLLLQILLIIKENRGNMITSAIHSTSDRSNKNFIWAVYDVEADGWGVWMEAMKDGTWGRKEEAWEGALWNEAQREEATAANEQFLPIHYDRHDGFHGSKSSKKWRW